MWVCVRVLWDSFSLVGKKIKSSSFFIYHLTSSCTFCDFWVVVSRLCIWAFVVPFLASLCSQRTPLRSELDTNKLNKFTWPKMLSFWLSLSLCHPRKHIPTVTVFLPHPWKLSPSSSALEHLLDWLIGLLPLQLFYRHLIPSCYVSSSIYSHHCIIIIVPMKLLISGWCWW